MRILIFLLGTFGLLAVVAAYAGSVILGEGHSNNSIDLGFYLGFAMCNLAWFLGLFYLKGSDEDSGLFEEIDESIFIIDRNSRTLSCINRAATDLIGFRHDDLVDRSASHLFAGNELIVEKLLDPRYFKKKNAEAQTISAIRKDGALVEMQCVTRPIRFHGADCVLVTAYDKSGRTKMLEDQARLAAILESSTTGLCATNREGVIANWNKAATQILGYRAKEVLGKPFTMLVKEENREERWRSYQSLLEGKSLPPYEGEAIHKNGNGISVYMDVSPIRDPKGEIVGASALFRDVGKSRESEKALREREHRLQTALGTVKIGIWDYDCINDVINIISDASHTFLGSDSKQTFWNYSRIASLIHPQDRQQSEMEFQRVFRSKSDVPLNLTARFQNQDGTFHWVQIIGQVMERNTDGWPVKILGVNRDVTKEVADRQREESERLRIKTLLAWSERTDASRADILDFTLQKSVELTCSPLGLIGQIDKEDRGQLKVSWLIQGVWPSKVGGIATHEKTAERFSTSGSPLWTKAIHTGEPMVVNTPDLDSHDRNFFGIHNPIEKYLTVPIREDGRITGVVMVANKEENYATHDVIELQLLAQGMWSHIRKIEIENTRKQVEQEHKHILDNLREGVLCFAKGYRVTFANHFACDMLGKPLEKIIGQIHDQGDANENYLAIKAVAREAFQTKQRCHKEVVATEGYHYDVTATPVRDDRGDVFRVIETFLVLSPQHTPLPLQEWTSPLPLSSETHSH